MTPRCSQALGEQMDELFEQLPQDLNLVSQVERSRGVRSLMCPQVQSSEWQGLVQQDPTEAPFGP